MGIVSSIKTLFGAGEEQRSINGWPWDTGGPPPYVAVGVDKALQLVPVFGAARLLADNIAAMPLRLYRMGSDGVPQRLPDPSLFNAPSVHGTIFDWKHRAVTSMALGGDAVGIITARDYYGFPTMIEWLNPHAVWVQDANPTGDGSYMRPIWYWNGRRLNNEDVVHIPWFCMPYRIRGHSPISAFQLTANIGLGAQEYASQWFRNGGVPPGVVKNNKQQVSQEDADIITSRITNRLQSRKPLVIGMDWDYTPVAIKPHEAEFVATCQLTATQIAVIYGVPAEKLGGTTGNSLTYCADTETEILTRRGWLRYDAVTTDDTCLTLNTDTGMSEWQPVRAVNVFDGPHEVTKMENTSHSSITTSAHRWPVSYLPGTKRANAIGRDSAMSWRTTETMTSDARICAAAPVVAPTEAKWADATVELIGWFWTEGWVGEYGSVTIAQSQAANPHHVSRIRAALTETFGPSGPLHVRAYASWREDVDSSGLVHFRLNKKAGALLLEHAPGKVMSTEFLSQLTRAQLELLIQTSIDADGWWRKDDCDRSRATIAQKDRARLDAFQVACTLAGKGAAIRQQTSGMWCMSITSHPWRKPAAHKADIENMVIDGPVWCPSTDNKTWFARRNGTVYATGNSTVEQNSVDFLTFSLRPWLVRLEIALSNLFPRGTYVRFDPSELLRMDALSKAQVDAITLGYYPPAWRTITEVRAGNDLAPVAAEQLPPPYRPGASSATPTTTTDDSTTTEAPVTDDDTDDGDGDSGQQQPPAKKPTRGAQAAVDIRARRFEPAVRPLAGQPAIRQPRSTRDRWSVPQHHNNGHPVAAGAN